jgi:aarF domain-containing kinase
LRHHLPDDHLQNLFLQSNYFFASLNVGLSLGKIGIGYLLQKVLVLCYTHQVKLEPKFVSVMVALGVVEGLGKRLDPDVDVLKRAAPYVFKAALFA